MFNLFWSSKYLSTKFSHSFTVEQKSSLQDLVSLKNLSRRHYNFNGSFPVEFRLRNVEFDKKVCFLSETINSKCDISQTIYPMIFMSKLIREKHCYQCD